MGGLVIVRKCSASDHVTYDILSFHIKFCLKKSSYVKPIKKLVLLEDALTELIFFCKTQGGEITAGNIQAFSFFYIYLLSFGGPTTCEHQLWHFTFNFHITL